MSQTNHTIQNRLACIDVLRGFDMFLLVAVCDVFRQFLGAFNSEALAPLHRQFIHVRWEGFVTYDLIMPLFLFTAGLSMPFSFGKLIEKGYTKKKIYIKILKRFCLLFLLGWAASGTLFRLDPANFRIYGNTLHAIAFGYLITSLIVLNCKKASMQLAAGVSLLVIYWALLAFAPVPGVGSGVLTPEGNFATYVEMAVFGRVWGGYAYLLASITFGATVYSGYYAGMILKEAISDNQKLTRLLYVGAGLIVAGLLLSLHQPIIKKIWTSSMVLYSSGISFLLLALSFLITDKWKIDAWWTSALRIYGLNAIAAYMIYQCFRLRSTSQYWLQGLEQYAGAFYPAFVDLCSAVVIFFILRHMYKHKIFLKV